MIDVVFVPFHWTKQRNDITFTLQNDNENDDDNDDDDNYKTLFMLFKTLFIYSKGSKINLLAMLN